MDAGRVRPNVFQRLIRQWDDIHPYNAAQVMRLRGSPYLAKLDCAWSRMLEELEVGPKRVVAPGDLDRLKERDPR